MTISYAVLTVSDTAASNAQADKSGPTIRELADRAGFRLTGFRIVPDEEDQIAGAVKQWAESDLVDFIITTGGTGFGVRDRTPETVKPLLDREAPGLVHLMVATSLEHTPLAALSRPVAGTLKNTLIVTLPGSVKAVRENLEALLSNGVVQHAIELIRGGDGKQVHQDLAESGTASGLQSHAHHHHHHDHSHQAPTPRTALSTDPNLPVSARKRVSPYPLISLEQALETIMSTIKPLRVEEVKVSPAITGRILRQDVHALQDIPLSQTTSVDGYALRASDAPGVYKVVTSQSHKVAQMLPDNTIYRINTGGPLPKGADTVIMVEDTTVESTFPDGEEKEVKTYAQVPKGENVRAPGSDVKKDDQVLQDGDLISSSGGELGTLAFVGQKTVKVCQKPVVAIMSTGNEIVDAFNSAPEESEWGCIWDTNRPSLQAALEGMGYQVVDLGVVPDDVKAHVEAIKQGLQRADLIVTTGGTSMGPSDLLKPVIEREFGGTVHFGRVAVKPGKPTTFATLPNNVSEKPLFALPGNPASALVMFYAFVVPALRKLGGWAGDRCQLPKVPVLIEGSPMSLDPRTEFHRVVIRSGPVGLKARSTGGQRSSRVASLSGANGLVILPQKTQCGPSRLEVGATAMAIVIGEIQM